MTLTEVRNKANAKLATFWTALQTRQDAYFVKHKRYFQLLVGNTLEADGVDSAFSVNLPSDEKNIVDIDTSWSDSLPFRIEVNAFDAQGQRGYTATAHIKLLNGDVYVRSRTLLDTRTVGKIFDVGTGKRVGSEWIGTPSEIDTGWSQVITSQI